MSELAITDLHVEIAGKEILKGVNLQLKTGEIHAIMGPNGTGKSTLSEAIMGNPAYKVTQGSVKLDGQELLDLPVDDRAWPLPLTRPLQKRAAFSIEAGAEFWAKGCVDCDWETALAEHGDLLEKHFGRAANFKENRLLGENVAKMEQGLFVYVPDNVALAEPLTVTYLQDSQKQEDFALHVLLVAGKNAAFSYFEKVASRGDKEATANLVVEI